MVLLEPAKPGPMVRLCALRVTADVATTEALQLSLLESMIRALYKRVHEQKQLDQK
jgi:hypothetical protein